MCRSPITCMKSPRPGRFMATMLLMLPLFGQVMAQEDLPPSGDILDLDSAITNTLSGNPSLIAFGMEMQAQNARILQAGIRPKPEFSVDLENVLGTGEHQAFNAAQTTFNITWILERGVREKAVDAARAATPVVASETAIKRLDAVAETARRYLLCLKLQARMTNALEGIRLAQAAVEAIEARVSAGNSPAAELARARAALAYRELAREDIEHELLSAYYRLGAQWGETSPSFNRVVGDIFTPPQVSSFESLKARLEQTPDMERFVSRQRMQEAQLSLEQARNRQSWRVTAGLRQLEQTGDQALVASFSMPVGRQDSNRGRIEEARTGILKTELESAAEKVRLETELFVIYQELQHSLQLTEALRSNIIPLYEQALLETETAHGQGRYNYQELSAAQTDLLAVREYFIETCVSIFDHLIEIERLTGMQVDVPQFTP
jgi:cobalt-zinc-cadmium efflux system outer membrane protein